MVLGKFYVGRNLVEISSEVTGERLRNVQVYRLVGEKLGVDPRKMRIEKSTGEELVPDGRPFLWPPYPYRVRLAEGVEPQFSGPGEAQFEVRDTEGNSLQVLKLEADFSEWTHRRVYRWLERMMTPPFTIFDPAAGRPLPVSSEAFAGPRPGFVEKWLVVKGLNPFDSEITYCKLQYKACSSKIQDLEARIRDLEADMEELEAYADSVEADPENSAMVAEKECLAAELKATLIQREGLEMAIRRDIDARRREYGV